MPVFRYQPDTVAAWEPLNSKFNQGISQEYVQFIAFQVDRDRQLEDFLKGIQTSIFGNYAFSDGIELYQSASTPYIDFHRAADPAGDAGADYNVRLINDASGRLSLLGGYFFATGGITAGPNAFSDPEPVTTTGSSSGISMRSRSDNTDRWVIYPTSGELRIWHNADRFTMNDTIFAMNDNVMRWRGIGDGNHRTEYQSGVDAVNHTMNSNIRFASTSVYVAQITVDGQILARFQDGNSRVKLGSWNANGVFGGIFNDVRSSANGNHYMVMHANNDNSQYYGFGADNGNHVFRCANNGSTIACFGNTNGGVGSNLNVTMGIPALSGGNTMNIQAGGNFQVGYISSSGRHKLNVRTLKNTPDPDSQRDNPLFKMRPVRFNWKSGEGGVQNAARMNSLHPNGVAGLIAEEVHEFAPDAVIWGEGQEEINIIPITYVDSDGKTRDYHTLNGEHFLPETDPATGLPVLHRPAVAPVIQGLDNDRLIAYLIDAVQYLESEVRSLRGARP